MRPDTFAIVNPASGSGRTGRRWPGWEARFRASGACFDREFTREPGHATELAREAARTGYLRILAVGGDGTVNETINGLIDADRAIGDVRLGVLPVGTGSDLARSLHLPTDPHRAWAHLRTAGTRPLDIGRISTRRGTASVTRYFANVAGLGFDGEVADRVNRTGRKSTGTIAYLATLLTSLAQYRSKNVTVTVDDQEMAGMMNSVIVCNAQYFGGGMRIAPEADYSDGLFDVIILGDLGKVEVVANLPRLYRGTHLSHRKVTLLRGRSVHVASVEPMYLQADGELIGHAPAEFTILPGALSVLV